MPDTKTIVSTATLHVPGPKFKPFRFTDAGFPSGGVYDVIHVKPGNPVTLDVAEADRLIERGAASLYEPPSVEEAPAPVSSFQPQPAGKK